MGSFAQELTPVEHMHELLKILRMADRVVLTTHITPDGDGLGSALALVRQLRRMGKQAEVINCSVAPAALRWLYEKGEFRVYNGKTEEAILHAADVIIATDLGGSARLGNMLEPIRRSPGQKVVIDHHLYENDLFDVAVIDSSASSTAELVYRALKQLGATFDDDIATPLYVGLVCDTGHFRYSSSTALVHEMAAHLIRGGVRPDVVYDQMECQVPLQKMRCLGLLLARIFTEEEGQLAWVSADRDFLERNQTLPRDAFEVVNYLLRLKGVSVGVFLLEVADRITKVSLRSAGIVDVSGFALKYGGGGHLFAAGCTLPFSLRETEALVVRSMRELLRPVGQQ
mgnify:CR=1 FL=1|jgi:phosphoesterase RecJ-like protein